MLPAACIDRLPDQDLRILQSTPTERLSADILWKDYHADAAKARSTYFRQPIVLSGVITAVGSDAPGQRFVLFGEGEKGGGVRANLLDEQAADILGHIPPNQRLTLKCFCEGLSGETITLKSCVRP